MGRNGPSVETVARAWELRIEGRSLRYIAEDLGCAVETARRYVEQGRVTEAWLRDDETDPSHNRALFAAFLEKLISDGFDRYGPTGGGDYETVAPIILRAAVEKAKMLGLYAATKYDLISSGAPVPPQEMQDAIRAVIEQRNGAAPH